MKQENITKLTKDLEKLIDKHSTCVEKNDFGTALNIMKNIDHLTSQLKHLDYETKVSVFSIPNDEKTTGNIDQLISIWKQNAFGNIKDINTYVIKEKYKDNMYDFIEKLSTCWNDMPNEMKDSIFQIVSGEDNESKINFTNSSIDLTIKNDDNARFILNGKEVYDDNGVLKTKPKNNNWYDILKFFVDTKQSQLIKLDYSTQEAQNKHRGTGKTTAILKLANEYKIPILSNGLTVTHKILKDNAKLLNLNNVVIVDNISKLNLSQYNKSLNNNIILIDEGSYVEKIDTNKYILIGFTK